MKICIYGAGAIGGYLGVQLVRAGVDVSLVARGAHLAAMRANGLKLLIGDEERVVHPRCTDTFGAKFATTNAGLLYTAKGTAALLVPIGNYMQQSSGSWDNVFIIAAGANILASTLAIAVLKPWRRTVVANSQIAA